MKTVSDRIEFILRSKDWSARELSRRSGLHESQISTTLKYLKEKDPLAITLRTLAQLAEGAGVRLAWLATGEGAPWEGVGMAPLSVPNRAEAARRATASGVWPPAVASVTEEEVPEEREDASVDYWLARIVARQEELIEEARHRRESRHTDPPRSAPLTSATPAHGAPSVPPATTVRRKRERREEPETDHEAKRGKLPR